MIFRFIPVFWALVSILLPLLPCTISAQNKQENATTGARIGLGIDTLEQQRFAPLRGKRVGLLTHPAGVNRNGQSTIQVLLNAPEVKLTALFGPEHGIYGNEKANVPVLDRIDERTGLPVFSLYGKYRTPTADMLKHIDVMVVDLQCVGSRSYTYISALRLVMEACFEANIEVVVLDRPNPLGGMKVGGPILEDRWLSYVGAYPIPYVYGLTIGELARMAHATPGWLKIPEAVRKKGRLTVIPMSGWRRTMTWPDTGLRWVPTSPSIPTLASALGYSMVGLGCQIGPFSHGYGTDYPFRVLSYKGKSPAEIRKALEARNIPGLRFQEVGPTPQNPRIPKGVLVYLEDWNQLQPTELNWHLMQLTMEWEKENPWLKATQNHKDLFNKHAGSSELWTALTQKGKTLPLQELKQKWQNQAHQFQQASQKFWLYPP
jgi:uncharacterized protein YbbC (DUF1343 family)